MTRAMKSLSVLAALLLGAWSPLVSADLINVQAVCPDGQVLRKIGTVVESNTQGVQQIVDGPIAISALSVAATTSATVATFYDGDVVVGEAADGQVVIEVPAVASGGTFMTFATPLYFRDGVSVVGANLDAAMVYTCQPQG